MSKMYFISLECKKRFFVLDSYKRHILVHQKSLRCSICSENITATTLGKHLLRHNIGIYECVYCDFGTNGVDEIRQHMCIAHPNKLLYVVCRVPQNQVSSF